MRQRELPGRSSQKIVATCRAFFVWKLCLWHSLFSRIPLRKEPAIIKHFAADNALDLTEAVYKLLQFIIVIRAETGKQVLLLKFPSAISNTHTRLVLKKPKTKTSVRRVYLPRTVAEMLLERRAYIDDLKELFGDEFTDYNLVFCTTNGRPIEGNAINKSFQNPIKANDLPKVVFHSLRHSSITYKLKLNGGDIKSVQGDSGHARVKMVAGVYSHILDDDRVINARRFEDAFYHTKEEEAPVEQPPASEPKEAESDQELLLRLLQNPEMAAVLKALAKNL